MFDQGKRRIGIAKSKRVGEGAPNEKAQDIEENSEIPSKGRPLRKINDKAIEPKNSISQGNIENGAQRDDLHKLVKSLKERAGKLKLKTVSL